MGERASGINSEYDKLEEDYNQLKKEYESLIGQASLQQSIHAWATMLTDDEIDSVIETKITMELIEAFLEADMTPVMFLNAVTTFYLDVTEEMDTETVSVIDDIREEDEDMYHEIMSQIEAAYAPIPETLRDLLSLGLRTTTVLHSSIKEFLIYLDNGEDYLGDD